MHHTHAGLIKLIKKRGLPVQLNFSSTGGENRIFCVPQLGFVHLSTPKCARELYEAGKEYHYTVTIRGRYQD